MQRSTNRILTTHAGSLPRTPDLVKMTIALNTHQPIDAVAFERAVAASAERCVARQIACGIDAIRANQRISRRSGRFARSGCRTSVECRGRARLSGRTDMLGEDTLPPVAPAVCDS